MCFSCDLSIHLFLLMLAGVCSCVLNTFWYCFFERILFCLSSAFYQFRDVARLLAQAQASAQPIPTVCRAFLPSPHVSVTALPPAFLSLLLDFFFVLFCQSLSPSLSLSLCLSFFLSLAEMYLLFSFDRFQKRKMPIQMMRMRATIKLPRMHSTCPRDVSCWCAILFSHVVR